MEKKENSKLPCKCPKYGHGNSVTLKQVADLTTTVCRGCGVKIALNDERGKSKTDPGRIQENHECLQEFGQIVLLTERSLINVKNNEFSCSCFM